MLANERVQDLLILMVGAHKSGEQLAKARLDSQRVLEVLDLQVHSERTFRPLPEFALRVQTVNVGHERSYVRAEPMQTILLGPLQASDVVQQIPDQLFVIRDLEHVVGFSWAASASY